MSDVEARINALEAEVFGGAEVTPEMLRDSVTRLVTLVKQLEAGTPAYLQLRLVSVEVLARVMVHLKQLEGKMILP